MKEFNDYILGGMTVAKFAAGFFFALLGVFLSLLLVTTNRDPNSARSPVHFSWSFLWCDNAMRIYKSCVITVVVIFLSLRFALNLIGGEATMIYALSIGLGIHKAIDRLRAKAVGILPPQNPAE